MRHAPERVLTLYTREHKRHKHAVPPRTRWAERPLAERSVVAAARRPATCAAVTRQGRTCLCANRGGVPRRRAPRQPADRIAPAPARRVRELPARRPLSSTSAPAVDHAAALWQLCCRIGRTTTVACQRVGSYARCHHLRPRATGSILGTNSRATQQAGELAAADPANRARLARRLQLAARRRPEKLPRGAPFGVELERAIAHGLLRSGRPGAPQSAALGTNPRLVSLGRDSVFPRLGVGVTLVTPPGKPSARDARNFFRESSFLRKFVT